MNTLNWINKRNTRGLSEKDVSISLHASKVKGRKNLAFRFRNNAYTKITTNKKMELAFSNNRVYFREGNDVTGFTVTGFNSDNSSCGFDYTGCDNKLLIGDYNLKYDRDIKCYYVETNVHIDKEVN